MKHSVLAKFKCCSRKSHCALEQQVRCCTVLTAGNSHTRNTLSGTRDLSHALPTLTNSVLSASCGVHSFTVTFTLTQFLLQTVKHTFSLKLCSAQIISYDTRNIPLYITTVLGP